MNTKQYLESHGHLELRGMLIGWDEFYEDWFNSKNFTIWYTTLDRIKKSGDIEAEKEHRSDYKFIMDAFLQQWCDEIDYQNQKKLEEEIEEMQLARSPYFE